MSSQNTLAHEFFELHVMPNFRDWQGQSADLRLAMNAVMAIYHMSDHYFHSFSASESSRVFATSSPGRFRAAMAKRDSCFAIIRDVAEAHKHMMLNRAPRVVTSSNQTQVGSTGYGEAGYGTGPYGGGPSIVIELDDGSKQHLSYVVDQVRQLWLSMLN